MRRTKPIILDIVFLILGSSLIALAIVMFTVPNNIAPGGVSGLATALASFIKIPIGTFTIILNAPIFLLAFFVFHWKNVVKSLIAAVFVGVEIDMFSIFLPAYTNNPLLASVFGGALIGAGLGLILWRRMTSGGTDLAAMMLKKRFPYLNTSTLLFIVDGAVIVFAVFVFGNIEVALYSTLTLFIIGKVVDTIVSGFDFAKVLMIITDRSDEVVDAISNELGKGATQFEAKGAYSKNMKSVIMTVVHRSEMPEVLSVVKKIDPSAFTIIQNATEVHGEGFKESSL